MSYKENRTIKRDFERRLYSSSYSFSHNYIPMINSGSHHSKTCYSHVSKCHHPPSSCSSQNTEVVLDSFSLLIQCHLIHQQLLSALLSKYILSLSTPLQLHGHGSHPNLQGLSPGQLKKPHNLSPCFYSTIHSSQSSQVNIYHISSCSCLKYSGGFHCKKNKVRTPFCAL